METALAFLAGLFLGVLLSTGALLWAGYRHTQNEHSQRASLIAALTRGAQQTNH